MKKLMIAAAIVCAAAVSQAAKVTWGFSSDSIVGPNAEYDEDGYIIPDTATAYLYVLGDDGKTWNQVDTATQSGAPGFNWGKFTFDTAAESDFVKAMSSKGDTAQMFKMILATDDGKYQIEKIGTATIEENVGTGSSTFYQNFADASLGTSPSDWKAVPEPTSGLLLLLGVAGLAHTCSHFASQSSGYALG